MNLLIVGAGGIGAYYAARLIQAQHRVVLAARGRHLQAMQTQGLRVEHETFSFDARVTAVDLSALMQQFLPDEFDAILLTLKATATQSVLDTLRPWLTAGKVPVISLQNGVDNEPLLSEWLGEERVIGGLAVRISGHILQPGRIEAQGPAQIIMGEWPHANRAANARTELLHRLNAGFNAAGIPTQIASDIRFELWRKLVINNGVNPLSALTGLDTHSLTHHPAFSRIVYGLMEETAMAANADGITLSRADVDDMFELIRSFNAIKTSMLVDRQKGRPLELDSIAGAVLRRCRAQGLNAPYTELVAALLAQQYQPDNPAYQETPEETI
ncbi:ketopantoate reductase family protein [Marinobacterium arenosum]|uniref:ketopantoate reductase family protein n=1 Tax=Marinobacterium arenosum TaxID=2862496 RepID=UPI001C95E0EF|nr:2-dehydropantoate 2-reductase [Marinobacterium arenosum]MBY4676690.1 2-dehydropantoate 2-reductase [Marinobacterium arenosum]